MCFLCIVLFDSHSRYAGGLAVSDGSSVLLKFSNILQFENYIQAAHSEFQGREWQYFQLQFIIVEKDDVEDANVNINRDIHRLQRNLSFLERTRPFKMLPPIQNTERQSFILEISWKKWKLGKGVLIIRKVRELYNIINKKKNKRVATIIRKQLCLHQAGKRYPNLKSLLKMGRSLYVLCAIVAYLKSSGNIWSE